MIEHGQHLEMRRMVVFKIGREQHRVSALNEAAKVGLSIGGDLQQRRERCQVLATALSSVMLEILVRDAGKQVNFLTFLHFAISGEHRVRAGTRKKIDRRIYRRFRRITGREAQA